MVTETTCFVALPVTLLAAWATSADAVRFAVDVVKTFEATIAGTEPDIADFRCCVVAAAVGTVVVLSVASTETAGQLVVAETDSVERAEAPVVAVAVTGVVLRRHSSDWNTR